GGARPCRRDPGRHRRPVPGGGRAPGGAPAHRRPPGVAGRLRERPAGGGRLAGAGRVPGAAAGLGQPGPHPPRRRSGGGGGATVAATRGRGGPMDADRTGRVIVGISTTLSGLHALRVAVAHARERRVPLHAVRTWEPPADPDVLSGSGPGERPLASAASATVASAFTETLGAVPADIEVRTVVVPDSPGPVLVGYACRDTDLLVIGTGSRSEIGRASCRERVEVAVVAG